jgi:C4-dicarboxylate-specific signal transduction histidine kinase
MKPRQHADSLKAPIGQMLSVYRHHLGNSVNAMQITVQVLMENLTRWDDAKIRTYLARLEAIANEQGQLLRALKTYALECGPAKALPAGQIWEQLTTMARAATQEREVALQQETPPPDVMVWSNLLAMESIWRHLIENACEAMLWEPDPQLTLRVSREEAFVLFELDDNGVGLSCEHLSKAQLPLFTTRKGKNGMGLAVVSKLVRELTGEFEMDSVADQGTQVRVRLQVASGHSSGESN